LERIQVLGRLIYFDRFIFLLEYFFMINMEDPDFLNAKNLKPVLKKAQTEMESLLEISKLLGLINKSRKPATKKILQNLIESSNEITTNDILSLIKANDDLILALFSTSYESNFFLLMSLVKCIKDMAILIEDKFTSKSNEYLKDVFNFWKNLNV
ncbi:hypothetical protein LCGC14_1951410, partial [marine sediment metagenome]